MQFHLTLPYLIGLPFLGMGVAIIGTTAGLGGGFILIPILFILFPETDSATIASISLSVVFLNALSATAANVRARRIDVRTAWLLLVGAVPAAALGAYVAGEVDRESFELYFAIMLLAGAVYTIWRASRRAEDNRPDHAPNREIRERRGPVFRFYVNSLLAGVISPTAGFVSSFFGIGGGVVHVPAMTFILKIPARVATATSLLVLVPTSVTGILTHIVAGQYTEGWRRAGLLGLGVIVGAQIGVWLSGRINQRAVMAVLALGILAVGLRQLAAAV